MSHSTISHEMILAALQWRYAVKKYDTSKKISAEDWKLLAASLVLTPSSFGIQPWRFFVVEKPETRTLLRAASWNQSQITDASHLVVFATSEKISEADVQFYIDRIKEIREVSTESLKGFQDSMVGFLVKGMNAEKTLVWAQKQSYIAMGFLLETAALLKIDATPMEGLDPIAYDKILELHGSGWRTVAAVTLGYRHADCELQGFKKVRFHESHVIKYI